MTALESDLAVRIWHWLPGRTDCRRVTLSSTIAAALDVPIREVSTVLMAMELRGHVVRDRATGSSGWHRGTPLPGTTPVADPVAVAPPEPTLF